MDMRTLIKLTEAWLKTEVVNGEYFSGPVDIHQDPSMAELSKLMKEFGFLRGFFDNDHVWVWRGDVLHHDIEVAGDHWIEWGDTGVHIHWNWEAEGYPVEDVSEVEAYVRALPRLKRLLPKTPLIVRSR